MLLQKPSFHVMAGLMIAIGLVGCGYFATRIFAAGSAQLYLVPASGSYNAGSNLAVQVMLNTGGESVNAVQADFSYPATKLQFVSIDATGSAFDIDASSSGGNGTVSLARGKVGQVTGVALVATIHFTVLSSAGTATLSFLNSSAVVRSSDNTNVLGTTTGATYTVVVPTPTPVPTATPTPTPTTATKTPTPKPTASASPTPTKTPVVGGPATSAPTVTPVISAKMATPAIQASSAVTNPPAATTHRLNNPTIVMATAAGGGAGLLVLAGVAWLVVLRRRALDRLTAPGSTRPYEPPSMASSPSPSPAPAPAATPAPPLDSMPTPAAPTAPTVYYPKGHPDDPNQR